MDLKGKNLTTVWTQCLWGTKKNKRTENHDRKWLTTNWPRVIKGKFCIDPELTVSWLRYMVENNKTIEQKQDVVKGVIKKRIPERDLREGELVCLAALLGKYEKEFETFSIDSAIWASNSGDKHPVVTMAQGSSEGGRGIKRQCEEGHAEPNSGGEHSAVTTRMTHASCEDRLHAHMPWWLGMHSQNWRCTAAMKRMRGKQPAPSGCGQPPAN